MTSRRQEKRGFTLIELLIVVAIIGILAAIAIPNFLEAQVRAKAGRALADLRSVGVALEMYAIDEGIYPAMREDGFAGGVAPLQGSELKWWYVPNVLSTPTAYLSDSHIVCPFGGNQDKALYFPDEIWKRYGYENIEELVEVAKNPAWSILSRRYVPNATRWSGPWRLQCVGPDKLWNPSVAYDPTNGTTSGGDIIRTQKSAGGNVGDTYDPWAS